MASNRKLQKKFLRYQRYIHKVNRTLDENINWNSGSPLKTYNRLVANEYRRLE